MEVAISGTKFPYFYIYYNNWKILIYKVVRKSWKIFIKLVNTSILKKIDKIDHNNDKTKFLIV